MRIAMEAAGFSAADAEELRRAMGHKRSRQRMREIQGRLMDGMRRNGIPEKACERIWEQLMAFADYGFPESHSASFALIVYASTYLKAHHHAVFTCAMLAFQVSAGAKPAGRGTSSDGSSPYSRMPERTRS